MAKKGCDKDDKAKKGKGKGKPRGNPFAKKTR